MFFGEYNYQLDEKNRVRLPSKLRNELSGNYVITKGTNNSLFIFSKEYFETQFVEKLSNIPTFDIEAQRSVRALLSSSYEVEEDNLLDFYDSEVVANDELLTKYLAKNKEAVLGEIIATIQKEQNDIIRDALHKNIIVQGVAGSGKTTVMLHRISYLAYNEKDMYKANQYKAQYKS